jgi:hypothetical protein
MTLIENAKGYNRLFGFNILPLDGKRPAVPSWEKFKSRKQSQIDLESFNWKGITGVGGISGVNNLRVLDIDYAVDNELLPKLLSILGLPNNYSWSVKSGSGKGFHIWFRMEESESVLNILDSDKGVYKLFPKRDGVCSHYEIRWKRCQTALPPTLHKSGNRYQFVFSTPKDPPIELSNSKLRKFIEEEVKGKKLESEIKEKGERRYLIDSKKGEIERAVEYISKGLLDDSYDEWLRIGFALASIGEDGREHFLKISLANRNYNDSEENINKKYDGLLKDYNGKIGLGTLFNIAQKYGYKKREPIFWREGKNKIEIVQTKYLRFLEYYGFGKLKNDNEYVFVKVKMNIVTRVKILNIKDFTTNYIASLPYQITESYTRVNLLNSIIVERGKLFSEGYLEFIETLNFDFKKDDYNKSYSFYKNCFVEITSNGITEKDYKDLDGVIWAEQQIKRDFRKSDEVSVFARFLFNVCRGDRDRMDALFSAIGYLLHNYKDANISKAICFVDERLSDSAFGRSGKGLVGNAISKMVATSKIDGRNFKFDKNFAFQSVTDETEVIFFDDVNKRFEFERLFSIITDGIVVEKKNQDSFYIPFEKSPKILITTNFSVEGADDSSLDRQFVIEFSDYYNKSRRPIDEFGLPFFTGWDSVEWNTFDNFMLGCLRFYLNEGLVEYAHINLIQKQLIDSTSLEFIEFIEDVELGKEYEKRELFEKFKKDNTDYDNFKQNTFTLWLKRFANLKELKYLERKSGASRYLTLIDKNKGQS